MASERASAFIKRIQEAKRSHASTFKTSAFCKTPVYAMRRVLVCYPLPRHGDCGRALAIARRTVHRSRKLCRPSTRHPSTHTSLPHPRRKLLAMWPVRVASLSHLDMLRKVVLGDLGGTAPHDKDVYKSEDFSNRSLNRTDRSDHQHGPNTMSRAAHDLMGSG